jgi:hypothetical protein
VIVDAGRRALLSKIRTRLTFANVVSVIALFVALGGGAYAAIKLPANSVGSKQIKKRAVTPAKVSPGTVALFKGQKGAVGPKGDTGGPGQRGDAGATGPTFGRFGMQDGEGCDPTSTAFISCATTGSINLPSGGQVLLVGTSGWDDNNTDAPNRGSCRLKADSTVVGPTVDFGEATKTYAGAQGAVSSTGVTESLTAGNHTFTLECNETEADIFMDDSSISAVLLGAG